VTSPAPLTATSRVSPHFTMAEFAVSASHPHLVVPVPASLRPTVARLAVVVLEPIRVELRRPMRILSGYRSKALNRAVKGSVTSQHVRGEAADWTTDSMRDAWLTVIDMVRDGRLEGAGQLIYYPAQGFIHAALKSGMYPHPTCCVHWPEGGLHGYPQFTPTRSAFALLVPETKDPNARRFA
jgi:hypothetical protein